MQTLSRHVMSIADHVVQSSRAAVCCHWASKAKMRLTGWRRSGRWLCVSCRKKVAAV
ncbi:hypothetical protein KCP74_23335 [Salmonella enterica subsp. enterica]|nr:hypothetical protein KCP74_23335 [Salmonella enterica subsp. enterica]